jgi:hypothetical protein
MRHAWLMLALVFVACEVEDGHTGSVWIVSGHTHPCNVRVTAPLQLDRASIAVDGTQTSWVMSEDLEHPIRELIGRYLGARKPTAASGFCYVPAGTHTIRIVKPGWEPIERVVTVSDPKTCLTEIEIRADDVKPVSR